MIQGSEQCDGGAAVPVLAAEAERAWVRNTLIRLTVVATSCRLRDAVRGWQLPNITAGVAVHSLRAARPAIGFAEKENSYEDPRSTPC